MNNNNKKSMISQLLLYFILQTCNWFLTTNILWEATLKHCWNETDTSVTLTEVSCCGKSLIQSKVSGILKLSIRRFSYKWSCFPSRIMIFNSFSVSLKLNSFFIDAPVTDTLFQPSCVCVCVWCKFKSHSNKSPCKHSAHVCFDMLNSWLWERK